MIVSQAVERQRAAKAPHRWAGAVGEAELQRVMESCSRPVEQRSGVAGSLKRRVQPSQAFGIPTDTPVLAEACSEPETQRG